MNGCFADEDGEVKGVESLDRIIDASFDHNFTVRINRIDPHEIYFWSNVPVARRIYDNLTTEFTDLKGLVSKMSSEKLTGFIDVAIDDAHEGGILRFKNGQIVGGSFSWESGIRGNTKENLKALIRKTKAAGGIFNVSAIPLAQSNTRKESTRHRRKRLTKTIPALEELLNMFEEIVAADKNIKMAFSTLLKKKLIDKSEQFPFLDPFEAQFEYADCRISFSGDVCAKDLATGVVDTVKALAEDLGKVNLLTEAAVEWHQKHAPNDVSWSDSVAGPE